MHFFSSSPLPWSNSALPPSQPQPESRGVVSRLAASRKLDCGWYDSSFDLARGLEVSEEDDDALYQLWALSRN